MKNKETTGTDHQQVDSFKYVGNDLKMIEIMAKVWEGEERPSGWKKGIICPLYRKGEKIDCTDFMVVTLYIVAYWTVSRVLFNGHLPFVCVVFKLITLL